MIVKRNKLYKHNKMQWIFSLVLILEQVLTSFTSLHKIIDPKAIVISYITTRYG